MLFSMVESDHLTVNNEKLDKDRTKKAAGGRLQY
jgi:hypothetical protein